jgi:hypothetical protein
MASQALVVFEFDAQLATCMQALLQHLSQGLAVAHVCVHVHAAHGCCAVY